MAPTLRYMRTRLYQQKTVAFLYYPVVSENKEGYFRLREANQKIIHMQIYCDDCDDNDEDYDMKFLRSDVPEKL